MYSICIFRYFLKVSSPTLSVFPYVNLIVLVSPLDRQPVVLREAVIVWLDGWLGPRTDGRGREPAPN